jgi:hypothetical protein
VKCTYCDKDIYLQCSDDNPYRIDDKPVCRKCYFEELGKVVDEHPIGIPIGCIRHCD